MTDIWNSQNKDWIETVDETLIVKSRGFCRQRRDERNTPDAMLQEKSVNIDWLTMWENNFKSKENFVISFHLLP